MTGKIPGFVSLFGLFLMLFVGASGCAATGEPEALGTSSEALCSSVSLVSDVPSYSSTPGPTVTWTATGSCSSTAQYAFNIADTNGVFTRVQDWSPSNQWSWPTAGLPVGTYYVEALVSDAVGTPTNYDTYRSKYFTLTSTAACTSAATVVSPAGQATVGASVTLTTSVTGCSPAEYRIIHRQPNGTFVEASPYSTANASWVWDTSQGGAANAPGSHYFEVWVRGAGSPAAYEKYTSFSYTLNASAPCTKATTVASPAGSASVGQQVTFTTTPTGCASTEYRIVHRYPNGTWVEASPYSTANASWIWDTSQGGPANAPGLHYFEVWIRAAGSTASYEAYASLYYSLQASAPCTGATLSFSPVGHAPSGTVVNLTASASGCGSPTYRFLALLPTGTWQEIQGWTSSPTAAWNTGLLPAGSYYVEVWTRAADSTAQYEAYRSGYYTLDPAVVNPASKGLTSGSYSTTCLLKPSGVVDCWGLNTSMQLGNASTTGPYSALPVSTGITQGIAIAGGYAHNCAVLSGGTVSCWGSNLHGQIGNGTTTTPTSPVAVSGISSAVSVGLGNSHSCAVLSDGSLRCWGYNSQGQLGNGVTVNSSTPVAVSGISNALKVVGGYYHTCALLTNGAVKCWGFGTGGQLGDGTSTTSLTPVTVSGLSGVTDISSASGSSCALKSDNTIWCWGGNSEGNLGDGSTTSRAAPVQVSGITTATSVAVNQDHGCAVLQNNTVTCWGYNGYGQLGNGTTTSSLVPVAVSTLTTATSVMVTDHGSCAALSDGTAACWGYGGVGGIGNGLRADQTSPVAVSTLP